MGKSEFENRNFSTRDFRYSQILKLISYQGIKWKSACTQGRTFGVSN